MSKFITFLFLVAGVLIGILFSTQFITSVPLQGSHPSEVLDAQQELIALYTEEQGILKNQITNLRAEIEELQTLNSYFIPNDEQAKLDKIKASLGLSELTGSGIEIILRDSPDVNRPELDVNDDALVHAADLRDILNIIFATDVKGVAINNQRVIYNSPANCVGNTILVNNFNMLPPFTISVITDNQTDLLRDLTDEKLLFDLYRRIGDHGITLKFQLNEALTLPVYNGNFRLEHISLVTE